MYKRQVFVRRNDERDGGGAQIGMGIAEIDSFEGGEVAIDALAKVGVEEMAAGRHSLRA